MKRFRAVFAALFLFAAGLAGCNPANIPALGRVEQEKAVTVALVEAPDPLAVLMGASPGLHPYCAGEWVDYHHVLTAAHCVSDKKLGDVVSFLPEDQRGQKFDATLLRMDEALDLAVLECAHPPAHATAHLAEGLPRIGDPVHVMGHPVGMVWTYMSGTFLGVIPANEIGIDDFTGPFLLIQSPIAPGDSGGGVYNVSGELLGVCSFSHKRAPGVGFYESLENVRAFLVLAHAGG